MPRRKRRSPTGTTGAAWGMITERGLRLNRRYRTWERVSMSKARVVVLEGTWWSNHEVPLVLPYFHALSISHREIDLCHRTIRSVEDIAYYVGRISKNSGAMLYFACHGEGLHLKPAGKRDKINQAELL